MCTIQFLFGVNFCVSPSVLMAEHCGGHVPLPPSNRARLKREQQKRSTARHVSWLLSLGQARHSHHTWPSSPPCPGCSQLQEEVASLRASVEQLRQEISEFHVGTGCNASTSANVASPPAPAPARFLHSRAQSRHHGRCESY